MQPEDVAELLTRDPFIPFRIHMSDGNAYEVQRSHSVAVLRTQIFVVLPDFRWKLIPLEHITSIETLQAA